MYKQHKVSVENTLSKCTNDTKGGRGGGSQYKKFGSQMAVSGQFQYKKLSRQMAVSTGKKNGKQFQPPPINKNKISNYAPT